MTLGGFSQGAQVVAASLITHPDNPKVARRGAPTSTETGPYDNTEPGRPSLTHGGLRHHQTNDHEPASTVCSLGSLSSSRDRPLSGRG